MRAHFEGIPKVRTALDGSSVKVLVGGGESMVRQSFKDECDINKILARYATSGQLPLGRNDAKYGDVSEVKDYKEALDFVQHAREQLGQLPDSAREAFQKDPGAFFLGLEGATSRDDLVALGLLEAIAAVVPAAEDSKD